jgi:hypothetical protein
MFTVTFHHLAPDAKKVGADYLDAEELEVNEKKLRQLIRAFATLAPTDCGTAAPELRVASPHGQFIVQVSQGRLRINSWTMRVGGSDLTPDQIFALITGAEAVAGAAAEVDSARLRGARLKVVALLVAVVIGTNAVTAWMLLHTPPNPFLPEFTPLAKEAGARLLDGVAGEYQSGTAAGNLALVIARNGHAHWRTFGPNQTVAEESDVVLQPVQARGKSALLADGQALIEIADAASIVFYNETYRRKAP